MRRCPVSCYANIRFAQDLTCLPLGSLDTPPAQLPLVILDAAIQTAKDLGDVRAESYALGRNQRY